MRSRKKHLIMASIIEKPWLRGCSSLLLTPLLVTRPHIDAREQACTKNPYYA